MQEKVHKSHNKKTHYNLISQWKLQKPEKPKALNSNSKKATYVNPNYLIQ